MKCKFCHQHLIAKEVSQTRSLYDCDACRALFTFDTKEQTYIAIILSFETDAVVHLRYVTQKTYISYLTPRKIIVLDKIYDVTPQNIQAFVNRIHNLKAFL